MPWEVLYLEGKNVVFEDFKQASDIIDIYSLTVWYKLMCMCGTQNSTEIISIRRP